MSGWGGETTLYENFPSSLSLIGNIKQKIRIYDTSIYGEVIGPLKNAIIIVDKDKDTISIKWTEDYMEGLDDG